MIEARHKFPRVRLDLSVVARESARLADDLTKLMVGQNQLSLLHYRKKVSGDTLKAVRGRTVQASATYHHRQVVGGAGYKFIRDGRRKGAKMPIRYVGTGSRGGKVFEPVPLLMRWFILKGIPRSAWFPICRAISRNGIKPTPIDRRAVQQARPEINRYARATGTRIARGIIRYAN